jgi:uncharacterized protein YjbI with pentapeptide repeats
MSHSTRHARRALLAATVAVLGVPILAPTVGHAAPPVCPSVDLEGNVTWSRATGVDWIGCNLTGAVLTDADLHAANLTGANFTAADLTRANLTNANLTNTNFTAADLPWANLTNANLTNTNFTGAGLAGADLRTSTLTGAVLTNTDLGSADLTGATLSSTTTFSPLSTLRMISGSITMTGTLSSSTWHVVKGYIVGPNVTLSGADLSGASMAGFNLTNVALDHANLSTTDLTGADLDTAQLQSSDLSGAALSGASMKEIIATQSAPSAPITSFNDADLTGVDFSGDSIHPADLRGASFQRANLTNANLTNAKTAGANFSESRFTGAIISNIDLSTSNLVGVRSGGVTAVGNPIFGASWRLLQGYLVGPDARLDAADFSNTDLSGAQLQAAKLIGSNLTNSNLTNADLTNADLTNADLTNADLTNADLTGATFTSANFTNTTCTDAVKAITHLYSSCAQARDLIAPTVVFTAPAATAAFSLTATFPVAWTITDNAGSTIASTLLQWQRIPAGGGTATPWTDWTKKSGSPFTGLAGNRYCFRGQATDVAGNTKPFVVRCTTIPYDDRALTRGTGWTTVAANGWLASTATQTKQLGARLTLASKSVRQIGVIATTCATCGKVDVYIGAKKVGTINLKAATTTTRKLVTFPAFATNRTGTIKLIVATTGKLVKIDGLAVRSV